MNCPKCSKNITASRSTIREEDGGIIIGIKCPACQGEFESFNIPDDFSEVYDADE